MAAQQRSLNWTAFRDASNRIVQASAHIPQDLATISSELGQLEHQPTNAMLQQQLQQLQQQFQQFQQQFQQQMAAMNHNTTSRIFNAAVHNDADQLAPLVNPQTNTPVPNFPASSAALSNFNWNQERALGVSLGMNDPGASPTNPAKTAFMTQLRIVIGLRPRPA